MTFQFCHKIWKSKFHKFETSDEYWADQDYGSLGLVARFLHYLIFEEKYYIPMV